MPNDFNNNELTELPSVISAPRFSTYMREKNGVLKEALALYRWNLQVSSAFFVPLQICEVAVRNGISEALNNIYTSNWPRSTVFVRSLPSSGRYNQQEEIIKVARRLPTTGKIVAELKFVFWQKMLTSRHEVRIWESELFKVFPGLPYVNTVETSVAYMHDDLDNIRELRNRIAHHEPIFKRDLLDDYNSIINIIHYKNPTAAVWANRIQTVTSLLAAKP